MRGLQACGSFLKEVHEEFVELALISDKFNKATMTAKQIEKRVRIAYVILIVMIVIAVVLGFIMLQILPSIDRISDSAFMDLQKILERRTS